MATGVPYQRLLRDTLTRYASLYQAHAPAGVKEMLVFDDERGQYVWLESGWDQRQRVERIIVHAHVREGQIWIEEDWTEDGIASALLREGVPATDIVLAFHDPLLRDVPRQPLDAPVALPS
jgi:hypothetical protein